MLLSRAIRTGPSRFLLTGRRLVTDVAATRNRLLEEIYKPFQRFPQDSPDWTALAKSGRVWEDHFQPADSLTHGYVRAQEDNAVALRDIEVLKASMRVPVNTISKEYAPACAYQSVQIGDNRLTEDEAVVISGHVNSSLDTIDLAAIDPRDLKYCIPSVPSDLVPGADPGQAIEFRNHLVASRWIAEASWQHQGTAGFEEAEVRNLAALTMRDLGRNGSYYPGVSGPKVKLGDYRATPISDSSNPLRIFPYPLEVPACMERLFRWRRMVHDEKKLHPLIIACQTVAYFLHIHPFPNGNGRVSRMIMQDYLLRQGYCPTVLHPLEREDYTRMISDAQDGKPDEFVARVVTNQLEMMKTNKMQETMDLRGVEEMDDGKIVRVD